MSTRPQWLKLHRDILHNAKAQRLPGELFKAWINILLMAEDGAGWLPAVDDMAFVMRLEAGAVGTMVGDLVKRGLV